jgi:hypothetical protein
MIPTIGIMIGGYIVLRCIDIFCRPLSGDGSRRRNDSRAQDS